VTLSDNQSDCIGTGGYSTLEHPSFNNMARVFGGFGGTGINNDDNMKGNSNGDTGSPRKQDGRNGNNNNNNDNTVHYHFIHSMLLPSTVKIQKELRGRKFKVRTSRASTNVPFCLLACFVHWLIDWFVWLMDWFVWFLSQDVWATMYRYW